MVPPNKGAWYQLHVERVLLRLAQIPDSSLRGDLLLIGMYALSEVGLSHDPDELAFITGLPPERIKQILPYLERFQDKAESWGDQLMPNFVAELIREQREFREKKASAGRRSPLCQYPLRHFPQIV